MLKSVNLALTFLLELCMLAALAYSGYQLGNSVPVKIGLGVGAPLLALLIWGRFMAPRSGTRLMGAGYLLVKLILFGGAALGLAFAGQQLLAIIFASAAVINQILMSVWKQDSTATGQA